MEAYTKKPHQCEAIFDVDKSFAIMTASPSHVAETLRQTMLLSNPMHPNPSIDYYAVYECMVSLKASLGRATEWRVCYNKTDALVTAFKMTHDVVDDLFDAVGRPKGSDASAVYYREESYTPTYAFSVGDWVLMDRDAATMIPKTDKHGAILVRTVHGASFENTYNVMSFL